MIDLSQKPEPHQNYWISLFLAPALALVIFVVDTFTTIESAVAVLYVLVMLLLADSLGKRGIIGVALACSALALLSFAMSHGLGADPSSILRLGVSVAAILMTGTLLLRDNAFREKLIETNDALMQSEWRFRSIFEQARFSLWEQDYTRVYQRLDRLRAQGITDLAAYGDSHPEFAGEIAELIVTTSVNDATLELMAASSSYQLLGPLKPFLPPDSTGFLRVIQALFEGRGRFEGRATIKGLDDKVRTVLIGITFPEDAASSRRVVANLVDITKREQTQEALIAARAELARASRAATVGALSASIAHEINQPLAALVMNAQTCLRWLRRNPPDVDAAYKAAERTVRDGERASAIVQKTRNMLVRGPEGDEVINLRELGREVHDLLERDLNDHSVRYRIDSVEQLPEVMGNRVDLQQVLVNLVTNGIQAMADRPRAEREIVILIDRPSEDEIRLAVRDRGSGIKDEDLAKLFDPFFTTKEDGMGMGLAISRSAIESRGGRLTAYNHIGGGAVFECTLPVARKGDARDATAAEA